MKVCELWTDKSKFTQEALARNVNGDKVGIFDIGAISWCLIGATCKCYYRTNKINEIFQKIEEYFRVNNLGEIGSYNDNNNFEVMKNLVIKLDI